VVVEEISEEEYASMVTLIRVKGRLELTCRLTSYEIINALRHLMWLRERGSSSSTCSWRRSQARDGPELWNTMSGVMD
jgi:hypothetical protein